MIAERRPRETACENTIIQAAQRLGFKVHAQRPGRNRKGEVFNQIKGDRGYPDLTIAGHGKVIFAELKRRPYTATAEQLEWLQTLQMGGVMTFLVWVPEEQEEFIKILGLIRDEALSTTRRAAI